MFTPLIKTMGSFKGLKMLQKESATLFEKAMAKGGIQFLNWANNGSKGSPKKPPIRFGVLRGSSTAFVDKKLVSVFDIIIKEGAKERPTPAKTNDVPKPLTLTFVWNTDYATRMHEHEGNWGKFTQQDGDAGNKWLEEHLKADKDDLIEFIKQEFIKSYGGGITPNVNNI